MIFDQFPLFFRTQHTSEHFDITFRKWAMLHLMAYFPFFQLLPNTLLFPDSHTYTTCWAKHDITVVSVPFISHADLYALGRSPWAVAVGWLRSFTHQPPLIDHWDGWVTVSCLWTGTSMRLGGGHCRQSSSLIHKPWLFSHHPHGFNISIFTPCRRSP